jgi:hypothetical protein
MFSYPRGALLCDGRLEKRVKKDAGEYKSEVERGDLVQRRGRRKNKEEIKKQK